MQPSANADDEEVPAWIGELGDLLDGASSEEQSWDDLAPEKQNHLLVLGYTPALWDAGESVPAATSSWSELSFGERFAVIGLGYSADGWDATPAEERFPNRPAAPELVLPSQIRFVLGAEWEGGPVPAWAELTQPMRNRAAFVGYSQESWDAEFAGMATSVDTNAPTKKPTATVSVLSHLLRNTGFV